MFHTCVRIFDVMGTVEKFLGTKQGLRIQRSRCNRQKNSVWWAVAFALEFLCLGNTVRVCFAGRIFVSELLSPRPAQMGSSCGAPPSPSVHHGTANLILTFGPAAAKF